WLGDRFGHRQVLLFALVLFTLSSGLCGTAQWLPQLVVYRVLQGAAGGMLTPVGLALLMRTFPVRERVRAASLLVIPTAVAPAVGPVLGGFLVDVFSWPWVFYVNVPIGLAAAAFGLIFLARHDREQVGPFDVVGFLLSGFGLAALVFAISEGQNEGWASPQILLPLVLGAVLVTIMVRHQLRVEHPLLKLRLYENRLFRYLNLTLFLVTAAFLGVLYVVAIFLQQGLGLGPLEAGLAIFPEAIGVMIGAQIASRVIYPRVGARGTLVTGLIGMAVCTPTLWLINSADQVWQFRVIMFALGLFQACNIVTSQAAAFNRIAPADLGRATALFNAVRQLGGAIGVALLATTLALVGARTGPDSLLPYHLAITVSTVIAVFALLPALAIDNDGAAEWDR
ncbi:MAG: DHA2 family efflux MFS transporter permease subunit, partial [Propionibacteriaceae bacterium]